MYACQHMYLFMHIYIYIYIYIYREREREREREYCKEERGKGRRRNEAMGEAEGTHARARERERVRLPRASRMHAIPFHTHIIKSPKSREIAPRRACPPHALDHLIHPTRLSDTHSALFPPLRSLPSTRSRTRTVPCPVSDPFLIS